MPKVFLHLGAHKTATTFIQANLRANRSALEEKGWRLIYLQFDQPAIYKHFRKYRAGKNIAGNTTVALGKFFKKIQNGKNNVFFTSETTLGSMSLKASKGALYPHHARMTELFKKRLKGCDITVGYAIRNFSDFIESTYNWYISNGATFSFERYIADIAPEKMSWIPIVENLVTTFGEENVRLWTYEEFKKDPIAATMALMTEVTGGSEGLSVPKTNPTNTAYFTDTLQLAMEWNRILEARHGLFKQDRKHLRNQMRKLLTSVRPDENAFLLTSEQRATFDEHYAKDVAEIFRRWPKIAFSLKSDAVPHRRHKAHAAEKALAAD